MSRISVSSTIFVFQTYPCFIRNNNVLSKISLLYQKNQCHTSVVKNMMFFLNIDVLSKIVMIYQTNQCVNKHIKVLLGILLFYQTYKCFNKNMDVFIKKYRFIKHTNVLTKYQCNSLAYWDIGPGLLGHLNSRYSLSGTPASALCETHLAGPSAFVSTLCAGPSALCRQGPRHCQQPPR